jgi:hypothetical protein
MPLCKPFIHAAYIVHTYMNLTINACTNALAGSLV